MNVVKVNNKKSIYKSQLAFLYTNSKLSEKEIKKTILFTVALKRIQYLGISPIKKIHQKL